MKSARAFTLLEILTVVTILAVLSFFAFPAINRMRAVSESAKCISYLRQIGIAIQGYANDHDMLLPGPMRLQSYGWVRKQPNGTKFDYSDHMAVFLAPYLNANPAPGQTQYIDAFYCPSCLRRSPLSKKDLQSYSGNIDIFGYPNNNSKPPRKLTTIKNLNTTVAWRDIYVSEAVTGLSTPSHETFYNTLFLDWHVGAILETKP